MKTVALGLLVAISVGCTPLKNAGNAGKEILVDCTKAEVATVIGELGPIVESTLLQTVDTGGRVNWDPIKSAAQRWTAEIGGCVLADVVNRALRPQPADPNAPQNAMLALDVVDLAAGFALLKTQRFGGVTFQLANGERL